MSEQAVASGMAGASMSGASPIDAGLSKAQTGLGKIVAQLKQVETLLTSIGKKSNSMSIGNASSGAGGGSIMSTSLANFSTPPSGGGNIIESGLAKFSGGSQIGNVLSTVAQVGLYAAGTAYAMAPPTQQGVDRMETAHLASMGPGSTGYAPMSMMRAAQAAFGGNASGINSDVQSALALSRTGMNPMSMGGMSIMRTAGMAYQTLGMDNTAASLAMNNFYSGSQGSQLFQFGIRTRDNKGNPLSTTSVVNQLYRTLYAGHKTPTRNQIGMDFQAGFLGQSLSQLGMSADQQQIVLQGLMAKADSVHSGTSFSMETVPGVATNAATNPGISQGARNASENALTTVSVPGLVEGFNKANFFLKGANDKLASLIISGGSAAKAALATKGFMETFLHSRQGQAVAQGGSGIFDSIVHGVEGYVGIKAAKSLLSKIAGGAETAAPEVAATATEAEAAATAAEAAAAAAGTTATSLAALAAPLAALVGGTVAAAASKGYQQASTGDKLQAFSNMNVASGMGLTNLRAAISGFQSGGFSGAWDAVFGGGNNGGTPSHASGSWDLPRDQIAHIHKGEMILPASIAAAVRNSVGKVNAGASAGPTHVTIKVMLQNGSDAEVLKVGKQIKSIIENPSLAQNMKES